MAQWVKDLRCHCSILDSIPGPGNSNGFGYDQEKKKKKKKQKDVLLKMRIQRKNLD